MPKFALNQLSTLLDVEGEDFVQTVNDTNDETLMQWIVWLSMVAQLHVCLGHYTLLVSLLEVHVANVIQIDVGFLVYLDVIDPLVLLILNVLCAIEGRIAPAQNFALALFAVRDSAAED